MSKSPKVAVLLAGCGNMDGAEIRESVFALLALDQHGAVVQCVAPDAAQHHVIDHSTGKETGESRNILKEAARIARGKILDVAKADPADYDALVVPGGYGVAKNHCGFAFKGKDAEVREDVAAFLGAFLKARKPVGAICIAPALVALTLAKQGQSASLTLGDDRGCAQAMEALGCRHVDKPSAREIVIDDAMNLVTTPAYMFSDARLSDVFTGIERLVAEVIRRV